MQTENIYKMSGFSILAIIVAIVLILSIQNKETSRIMWDRQEDILVDISQIRLEMDIIKGKMEVYENLPIDIRNRMEIIEMRVDNIIFFKEQLEKDKENEEENDD